jgi:hypothetical protein
MIRHKTDKQNGAVLVELAMSSTLMLIIVLGFAQLYLRSIEKIDHYALATQLVMGPQAKSMSFNSQTGVFSELSGSTSPTSQQYLTLLLNFLEQRAPNTKYAFYAALGYIRLNPTTGIATGRTVALTASRILSSTGGGCEASSSILASISSLANGKLQNIVSIMGSSPATTINDDKAMGLKLYDFYIGDPSVEGNRKQQYAEVYPYIFLIICSNNVDILYSEPSATFHVISPRRHIN